MEVLLEVEVRVELSSTTKEKVFNINNLPFWQVIDVRRSKP